MQYIILVASAVQSKILFYGNPKGTGLLKYFTGALNCSLKVYKLLKQIDTINKLT